MTQRDERKIQTLSGVREHGEGSPVELWIRDGHAVIRAFNEGHNNYTDVDLSDLLTWLHGIQKGEIKLFGSERKPDWQCLGPKS